MLTVLFRKASSKELVGAVSLSLGRFFGVDRFHQREFAVADKNNSDAAGEYEDRH